MRQFSNHEPGIHIPGANLMKLAWGNGSQEGEPERFSIYTLGQDHNLAPRMANGDLDPFLDAAAAIYRDAYGFAPWNEYLKCTAQECGITLGADAAYGLNRKERLPLKHLEANREPVATAGRCPACGSSMALFYEHGQLVRTLKEELSRNGVAVALYDDRYELVGLSYAWLSSLKKIWEEKYSGIYGRFIAYQDFVSGVKDTLVGEISDHMPLFYVSDWLLLPKGREGKNHIRILREMSMALIAKAKSLDIEGEINILGYTDNKIVKRIYNSLGVRSIYKPDGSNLNTVHCLLHAYRDHVSNILAC